MDKQMQKPVWISHRGLCQHHDENTYQSFQAAKEAGFSILETDLRITKDNHIVLMHDEELSRVTKNKVAGSVNELTKEELDFIELKKGGRVYYLNQFMEDFKKLKWVFDIKPETAQEVLKVLDQSFLKDPKLIENIFFLFWNKAQQKEFLKKYPKAICFAREDECIRANLCLLFKLDFLSKVKPGKIYSIPPKYKGLKILSSKLVDRFHKKGAKIIAYLPEDKKEQDLALESGCDYIISNHQLGS